ncbi:hypothetical protein RND81_05G242600 [Saponaria officinalis]|uniref:Protein FLUORESCENT IN BLUE LIGHT, chloroplastic n=1 Tax=Saponaria officinalis TaxID=3572 RepID=A0AAW1L233_SAPOF
MAMFFHCSSLLGPPKQLPFYSWQNLFSTKFRFHGMQPSDPGKLLLSGRDFTSGTSNTCWSFPRESSASQFFDAVQMFKPGRTCIHISQQLYDNISQGLFVNQEAHFARFPALAFLLTNSLLMGLAMPLEALAETCEADNSVFNMPLLLLVALVGATVGGLVARQRKEELQRLNEQLRQINAALRRQAKIESYAPALSYAPVPVGGKVMETEVIVDPKKEELISRLKTGKNYLRNQEPDKAFAEFKIALQLAQDLKDPIEEKKAARGLGASLQRQGKYREAINYHKMVLAISKRVKETSGNTEAYGAIADCYTELGDLENAGKFYDKYIARLETD